MSELCNAFERQSERDQATVPRMMETYHAVSLYIPDIQRETGAQNLFGSRAFHLLYSSAVRAAGTAKITGAR